MGKKVAIVKHIGNYRAGQHLFLTDEKADPLLKDGYALELPDDDPLARRVIKIRAAQMVRQYLRERARNNEVHVPDLPSMLIAQKPAPEVIAPPEKSPEKPAIRLGERRPARTRTRRRS